MSPADYPRQYGIGLTLPKKPQLPKVFDVTDKGVHALVRRAEHVFKDVMASLGEPLPCTALHYLAFPCTTLHYPALPYSLHCLYYPAIPCTTPLLH